LLNYKKDGTTFRNEVSECNARGQNYFTSWRRLIVLAYRLLDAVLSCSTAITNARNILLYWDPSSRGCSRGWRRLYSMCYWFGTIKSWCVFVRVLFVFCLTRVLHLFLLTDSTPTSPGSCSRRVSILDKQFFNGVALKSLQTNNTWEGWSLRFI
jgi:hypothetical protein